ncbi:MAG: glycosyltransferase family 39 protein [bacterium]|nr:glycosyltransferase family 39 protein [bacterium]
MNNSIYQNFIKEHWPRVVLGAILLIFLTGSWATLTTKPRLWIDEAKSIELARSFLGFGKLNVQIAPGEFTDFPELLQSTGYPVTVPLAIFFKIFGYGLVQARIYMLIWMAIALMAIFVVGRSLFGEKLSLLSVGLIVTFASFHDSGRTVVGEIPGFIFLLIGFYLWLNKNSYFWSGVLWGLAIVTKPSVFTWILPVMLVIFLLEKSGFFKKLMLVGLGALPAAAGWVLLVLEQPFSKSAWVGILNFYQNPYSAGSLMENVAQNLLNAPLSTTLIYFGILFILLWRVRTKEENIKLKSLYSFIIIYGIFAFIYYLRSPGWLRYILIAELLILFVLPAVLSSLLIRVKLFIAKLKLNPRRLPVGLALALIVIQLTHLFTGAQIFYSDSEIKASRFLNEEFLNQSIGTINSLALSVLLKTDQRFQIVDMAGIPTMGTSPLLADSLPEVIVFSASEGLSSPEQLILDKHYSPYSNLGSYSIFVLN